MSSTKERRRLRELNGRKVGGVTTTVLSNGNIVQRLQMNPFAGDKRSEKRRLLDDLEAQKAGRAPTSTSTRLLPHPRQQKED